tara:strand:+ start:319 stop:897 length:579 start_codon:yes stop_codon:yes gene_type:complete
MGTVVYTKEELKDIFDIVNSTYLKLNGRKKTISKNQFVNVWQQENKSLSAFELVIALYRAEGEQDKRSDFLDRYVAESAWSDDYVKTKKSIPFATYIKRLRYKEEELDELRDEMDDIVNEKNMISNDSHQERMNALKKDMKVECDEKDNEVSKIQGQLKHLKMDTDSKINRLEEQVNYYKTALDKITSTTIV